MTLRVSIFAVLGLIASQSAQAAPCVQATFNTYLGTTCTFANELPVPFTAKDFVFDAFNLNPSVPVELATAADILTSPPGVLDAGFRFSSQKFRDGVTGQQSVGYLIEYFIDPPPPIIPGFDDFLFTETPKTPGFAIVTTELCVGGEFVGEFVPGTKSTCVSDTENAYQVLTVFHKGTDENKQLSDSVTFTPTNTIDVRNFIELTANGASSSISGFGNTPVIVPEPSTIALGAIGLAALALLRRHRLHRR